MTGRSYKRLEIEEFGKHLLESGDLDPVYIALHEMHEREMFRAGQMERWLIAYWCFYHCGLASWASEREGMEFWEALMTAAVNTELSPVGDRWPRGHERRHARGGQGIKMVSDLRARYGEHPESMVEYIAKMGGSFQEVSERVREHTLFGPWIGFKISDMVERVLGWPVGFDNAAVFMFKDPEKAAFMLWQRRTGHADNIKPKREVVLNEVVDYLLNHFKDYRAKPREDRAVNIQEIETILCKYKSHLNGHYPLNNDIDEINTGLGSWKPVSETVTKFLEAMPRRLQWDTEIQ